MHRRSHSVSLVGLATVVLVSSLDAQPSPLLPAPRQVETLSRRTDPHRAGALVGVTRVEVDLGTATTRAWPLADATSPMTVLGTRGSVVTAAEDVIKVCEQLCGDSGEECHYVARLAAGDLDRVGVPLAAIPGSHPLTGYEAVPESPVPVTTTTDAVVSRFVTPIWADASSAGTRYRIRDTADGTVLDYAWSTSGGQAMPVGRCAFSGRGPFTRMRCDGLETLLFERQPLLVSVPDYNVAGVDVVASFVHDDRRYFVVWLAVKTQSLYGLLYQEDGRWQARFHPRDYSLLC